MLTLSDIRSRVRTRFEASSTRWSDEDIDEAINDGLAELSEATGYYERATSVWLKGGRTYYDLRAQSDTILSVTAVHHESGVRWLTPANLGNLTFDQWETTAGNPTLWFTRGAWWLGVWPRPSADLDEALRVYYTAVAPPLEEDGEVPDQLPEEFVPAL